MIHLDDKNLIASSKTRNCYLHPEDHDKIIKIVRKGAPVRERAANSKEWAHYLDLKKQHSRLDFISIYHGFVDTNLGQGLLVDCVRDYNGQISMRLHHIHENYANYDLEALKKALDEFCQKIIEKNIQLYDLNWFNLLIQIQAEGKYRPVCVDIKGRYNHYEFIPVSSYIPFFSRMKLKRRSKRLIDYVQLVIQQSVNPERSKFF